MPEVSPVFEAWDFHERARFGILLDPVPSHLGFFIPKHLCQPAGPSFSRTLRKGWAGIIGGPSFCAPAYRQKQKSRLTFPMAEDINELVKELCKRASIEQDPKKLLMLTTEINRLLMEKPKRVEGKTPANSTPAYIQTTPSLASPRQIERNADPSHPQKTHP